jgi:hypothetical protein
VGERLYLNVDQSKPAMRMGYTFRCTHAGAGEYELIKVTAESQADAADANQLRKEIASLRWEVSKLQLELAATKFELTMARALSEPTGILSNSDQRASAAQTPGGRLKTVVAWLAAQDRIDTNALREQLLPLDLLTNSVVDELNEMALDLTGEIALEEVGNEIIVSREILGQVLSKRDW